MNIARNFAFATNEDKENTAVSNIIGLYVSNKDGRKTPNETMALLLDTIAAACDVVQIERAPIESEELKAFNEYITKISDGYKSGSPQIPLMSPTLLDACDALDKLRKLAPHVEHWDYIDARIARFTDALRASGRQYLKKSKFRLVLILIALGAAFWYISIL